MKVFELVKEVIGPLPIELEFIYAIGVCIVLAGIIYACIAPFAYLYDTVFNRW